MQKDVVQRGWLLTSFGALIMVLAVWLPTLPGDEILANADEILNRETRGPRLQPVSGIAVGLVGGYIILFGGLIDLRNAGVPNWARTSLTALPLLVIAWLVRQDYLDIYSVMVEYNINGDNLGNDTIKHFTFVLVSLITGLVLGITLGLWASRDERVSPIIMYAVGIIQTIPSLALFGVLLVPLSNLGDRDLLPMLGGSIGGLLLMGTIGFFIFRILTRQLPEFATSGLIVIWSVIFAIPLGLLTLMANSFLFRIAFDAFTLEDYSGLRNLFVLALLATIVISYGIRFIRLEEAQLRLVRYLRLATAIATLLVGLYLLGQSAQDYVPSTAFSEWQLRDIGIAGIGIAPTLVALTLYSLLPITRNTYVGLVNVDPAIIDSGRGMGMSARQIFFQIELPLAFPVIMAGVRNAGVALVGIATIATVIGGGGLGDYVLNGITNISVDNILLGTIPAILLAIALDIGLRTFENAFVSPGIRQETVAK